jgi:hypothetical protein
MVVSMAHGHDASKPFRVIGTTAGGPDWRGGSQGSASARGGEDWAARSAVRESHAS